MLNAVLYGREFAGRLEQVFAEDLKHSRSTTSESWRRRPLKDRLFETLAVPIRDLL